MKISKILFLSSCLFSTENIFGQLQASYWATEGQQLLDVSIHPPKIIGFNNLGQWWSTIADDKGEFLFYTDGSSFFDQSNKLIGKSGIEHSILDGDVCILPYPGKSNLFNVFFIGFIDNDPSKGAYLFSCNVDLSKKYDAVTPRQIISKVNWGGGNLEVTATRTSNCQSYWVIVSDLDTLKSYYVDKTGIKIPPVNSKINAVSLGTLKIAPNGKTAAIIEGFNNGTMLDILDFDKTSGKFSVRLKQPLRYDHQSFSDFEFSPNSKNIFVQRDSIWNDPNPAIGVRSNWELWVYKSGSTTIDELANSGILLYEEKKVIGIQEGIQLTPTGRIYSGFSAGWGNSFLSVINNPNAERKEDFDFEVRELGPYYFAEPPSVPSFFFQNLNYGSSVIPVTAGKDTLVCRGDNVTLHVSAHSDYTYEWRSNGNLNSIEISNPTLISPVTPSASYDTIYNYIKVSDSLCRQGTDTVKVIYKPAVAGKIEGSKSVCPGVKEVAYWMTGINNDKVNWDISGGQLTQNFSDSITVNWSTTNFSAQVKVQAINTYGCPDFVDPFPVKIYKQLDTETPNGMDTLQCGTSNYRYKIQSTNGSVYHWSSINGLVNLGNGTNEVNVTWDLTKKFGDLWIDESVNTDLETCYGQSDTLHIVNPQAFGSENIVLYAISSVLDKPKTVSLNYEILNSKFFEPSAEILWKTKIDQTWQPPFIVNSSSKSDLHDFETNVSDEYLFQLEAKNTCANAVNSGINSNIFLRVKKDSVNETLTLVWNKPARWNSVGSYVIYRASDLGSFVKYDSLPGNTTQRAVTNTLDGFQFQFYVVGYSEESPFPSYSNQVDASFEHIPFIPNVITPNGDHLNDYFVIERIEAYTENFLSIYNRYGATVYEQANYQNTWNGDNLSAGVYYYYFRTEKFSRVFKGWIEIMK